MHEDFLTNIFFQLKKWRLFHKFLERSLAIAILEHSRFQSIGHPMTLHNIL
jgi:hypothetical protein